MKMKFGIFMAPFHAPGHNPTLSLENDLELGGRTHGAARSFDAWAGDVGCGPGGVADRCGDAGS